MALMRGKLFAGALFSGLLLGGGQEQVVESGNFLLLSLMPVFMQDTTTPNISRKPFPAREVIPRRLVGKIDKLRDDDALCIILLM